MKIRIKSNKLNIRLWFPSVLIFNPITATFMGRKLLNKTRGEEENARISPKAARKLFREINRCRRKHKNWTLADICASDGTEVNVRL